MKAEQLLAVVMLVSLTLGAGLQVDREHLKAILKNVGLLGRALLANFVIVPALGFAVVKLFRLPLPVATGVLLMAIAPGVPFVLASVRKRGGRLALAVELAVFLPLLSIVTVPLTAALLLPDIVKAELPLARFGLTLVLFQLLPLVIGIAAGGRFPELATRLGRPLQILFFGAAAILIIILIPQLVHGIATVYGSLGLIAMLLLTVLSMATGWLLGGPALQDRRVLGLGTTLRNVGLCALIATSSLRNSEVTAAVLSYLVIQLIVTTFFGSVFARKAKEATA
ncbi:MAG: bile acid:sodium symporter [Candidatus Eremiobacteraeota bacterium]|nr:bile acid:sodium symporter [Candidatus Eremiobacteraeota bacterium]